MKYIGIKEQSVKTRGNKGDIWERNDDGFYYCNNNPAKNSLKLSGFAINSDFRNGFLKIYTSSN